MQQNLNLPTDLSVRGTYSQLQSESFLHNRHHDHHHSVESTSSLSGSDTSPQQNTKCNTNKPLIERKRRARINEYLSELKLLIMEDLQDQPGRLSKLDKAELLEMVVESIKRKKEVAEEMKTANFYRLGANECAWSVQHFLSNCEDVSPEVRIRLLNHLASWMHHNSENQSPGGVFNPLAPPARAFNNSDVTTPERPAHFPHYLFQLLTSPMAGNDVTTPRASPTTREASRHKQSPPSGGKSNKSRTHSHGVYPYHNLNAHRGPLVDRNNNNLQ